MYRAGTKRTASLTLDPTGGIAQAFTSFSLTINGCFSHSVNVFWFAQSPLSGQRCMSKLNSTLVMIRRISWYAMLGNSQPSFFAYIECFAKGLGCLLLAETVSRAD
jgi:hypothetical protein